LNIKLTFFNINIFPFAVKLLHSIISPSWQYVSSLIVHVAAAEGLTHAGQLTGVTMSDIRTHVAGLVSPVARTPIDKLIINTKNNQSFLKCILYPQSVS
jgi:hypothetical protein